MPNLNNLKSFIKSKRLAIKSCYFLTILLLVFISAIIMITNDYKQNSCYSNAITTNGTSNNFSFQRTFNTEDKINSSKDAETLKVSVFYIFSIKITIAKP